jgi:TRAP-type transport system periplasmic protein
MKKAMLMTLIAILVSFFVLISPVQADDSKPVELKLWSAWIPDTFSSDPFLHMFIERVNKRGKDVNLSIKLIGGPEVFKAFDGIEALRNGVVDAAYTAAVYHARLVPEARAMMLTQLTPIEERKSGAQALMNKFHEEKAGIHFLFRLGMQPYFNFYMNKPLDKVDFKGLKLRSTPAYDAIIKHLGGAIIRTQMSEVYTALERGVIQGYGFPTLGISDHKLDEVTKYIWGPSFYASPTGIFLNLSKWKSLSDSQRLALTEVGIIMEIDSTRIYPEYVQRDRELIKKAGVKVYKLSPANEKKLLDITQKAGWGMVMEKAPGAAALKPLMSK